MPDEVGVRAPRPRREQAGGQRNFFVAAYADKAAAVFANRSPIERAVLGFIQPRLLQTERDFLAGNEFQMTYKPYDWSLNDLTGRGGR